MDRRALLQWMIASTGVTMLQRLNVDDLLSIARDAREHGESEAPPTLTATQLAIVTTAAEHIIPETETAGATRAGVPAFIQHMLSNWYPAADAQRFVSGLRQLDQHSVNSVSVAFRASTPSQQLATLQHFDDEVTALRSSNDAAAAAHWFAMLKFLTVWGYCTSEVAMRDELGLWPMPMRYDGNASMAR